MTYVDLVGGAARRQGKEYIRYGLAGSWRCLCSELVDVIVVTNELMRNW